MLHEAKTSTRVTTALFMALFSAAAAAAQVEPSAGWNAIAGCARQVTDRARHACVDQVLRDAGLLDGPAVSPPPAANLPAPAPVTPPSAVAAAPPSPAPVVAQAAPPPPQVVAAPPATVSPPPNAPAAARVNPMDMPDRQELSIAAVRKSADGRLILTASDGVVWRQNERQTMSQDSKVGDSLSIRKAAMGSFICSVTANPSFRCKPDARKAD